MRYFIKCEWCSYEEFGTSDEAEIDGLYGYLLYCLRCRRATFVHRGKVEEQPDAEEEIQDDFCAIPKITDT